MAIRPVRHRRSRAGRNADRPPAPGTVGGGAAATIAPRCSASGPAATARERPAAGWISTMFGTATTTHPAAAADVTPVGESSMATHCTGSTPSFAAARTYGSGWGLPLVTASPVMTTSSGSAPAPRARRRPRRHDIVTSAHGTPCWCRSVSRRRAPGRHGMRSRIGEHPDEGEDRRSRRLEPHPSRSRSTAAAWQVEADDPAGVGLVQRPPNSATRSTPPPSSTAQCRRACRPCPAERPPARATAVAADTDYS